MVQEGEPGASADCRPGEVLTAETASTPKPTIPINMTATLVRSETFELTSPTIDPAEGECPNNISVLMHNHITMLKTSSPNTDSNPAKRKFGSFGESSSIFNTSETADPEMTIANRKEAKTNLGSSLLSDTPDGQTTIVLNSNRPVALAPTESDLSLLATGEAINSTAVFQSTMVVPEAKLIDITTNVARTIENHPWNLTEVLPRNNLTHLLGLDPEATIMAAYPDGELLMDVDEPEDLMENCECNFDDISITCFRAYFLLSCLQLLDPTSQSTTPRSPPNQIEQSLSMPQRLLPPLLPKPTAFPSASISPKACSTAVPLTCVTSPSPPTMPNWPDHPRRPPPAQRHSANRTPLRSTKASAF